MVRTANSATLNSRNYERTFKLQDLYHHTSSHYHYRYHHLYHPQPRTLHTHQHKSPLPIQPIWTGKQIHPVYCLNRCPRRDKPRTQKITYPILTASPRLGLNASEQREFQARMERKQMKEFMNVRLPLPLIPQATFSRNKHQSRQIPLPPPLPTIYPSSPTLIQMLMSYTDVLRPRRPLLRLLHRRLHHQVPHLARVGLRQPLRAEVHGWERADRTALLGAAGADDEHP